VNAGGATPPVPGSGVGLKVGVVVTVPVWVGVGVTVGEAVGDEVTVTVGVSVVVAVGVLTGVDVRVCVGVAEGVPAAGVGVGRAVVVVSRTTLRIVTELPAATDPMFHCSAMPISTTLAETWLESESAFPLFRTAE
jgi:hypothetical protein